MFNSKTNKNILDKIVNRNIESDPYQKLENKNDIDVARWINYQNQLTRSLLTNIPNRKEISKRLKELWDIEAIGIPIPKNGYYFTTEKGSGEDLKKLYMRKGLEGEKRLLIDENKLSGDKTSVIKGWSVSENVQFLVYAVSAESNDRNDIYVLDIKTGQKLKDYIPADVYPGRVSWHPDSSGFLYSKRWNKAPENEEKLHQKIYYHKLGDNFKKDELIFGENIDKNTFPSASFSPDGNYILVTAFTSGGKVKRNDIYLKNLRKPESGFIPVVKDVDALFGKWVHRDRLFVLTNHRAPCWKLMSVPLNDATEGMDKWDTVIPEGKYVIRKVEMVGDKIFVETMENVHSVLKMYDSEGKGGSEIDLPALGSVEGISGEREGEELFFSFSSFSIPPHIYRFDLKENQIKLFDKVKFDIDFEDIVTEQIWFRSKDNTKIPMFLVHKKGINCDGKNPTLLYGYGGFGRSQLPGFSVTKSLFIEYGGIVAIPNIRGGGEFGEDWHKAGVQNKKQNVFDDFAAAALWLIEKGYTSSDHLSTFGWSNGGLLMGAMVTQYPDLFKAVVAGAPVMDMARFHKFHGGVRWVSEYGNPDNPKMLDYLLGYSPYHNIKEGENYPAVLVLTAKEDDRVHPMHSYKFIARLQEANSSDNPILLRVEEKAGHGGPPAVSNVIEEFTDVYSFLFWQLGIDK